MPIYKHEGIVARFPDELVGMSVSGLLSNRAVFHVKVSPQTRGELFAFLSPDFQTKLVVGEGFVEFRRNDKVARKEIGTVQRHFQILVSWKPDRFHLALMVDDDVGGEEACVTVDTKAFFVPLNLLQWARRFNLTPRTTYNSPAEFLSVFLESIRQAERIIRDTSSHGLFWDRQKSKGTPQHLVPKREPEAMSGVAAFLQDQSLLSGYQLIRESAAGAGSIDLRALATLSSGGFVNVCMEGKNAHSPDLKHGITDQLPSYMQSTGADYGVYLVLWYKCNSFQEPKDSNVDVTWSLTKLRPWENIIVESFNLARPSPPSDRSFEY